MLAGQTVNVETFDLWVLTMLLAFFFPLLLGIAPARENPSSHEYISAGEALSLINQVEMLKVFYGSR